MLLNSSIFSWSWSIMLYILLNLLCGFHEPAIFSHPSSSAYTDMYFVYASCWMSFYSFCCADSSFCIATTSSIYSATSTSFATFGFSLAIFSERAWSRPYLRLSVDSGISLFSSGFRMSLRLICFLDSRSWKGVDSTTECISLRSSSTVDN